MTGFSRSSGRPRIAVFSGPTATIQNSSPLVTGQKTRREHGLAEIRNPDGSAAIDALRPQRLAASVTVYVEQFSAHPLERDTADLYAPPDGYVDASGTFAVERRAESDIPVLRVTLEPEDGLYLLPYAGRQASGEPWDGECTYPGSDEEGCRQTFYPDASRVFEEIDRFGVDDFGHAGRLSSRADFDFIRAAPSAGYTKGLPASARTDAGPGPIPPEVRGRDYFAYRPYHLQTSPTAESLAKLTNVVQGTLEGGEHEAALWLEGSPSVEETSYWLGLVIDTRVPIIGISSQRMHGTVGNDGDRNVIDAVDYVVSRIWQDSEGRDRVGPVVIADEQVFTARDVQKADARPGGYTVTGGHGGIVATIGQPGAPVLTFVPVRSYTHASLVNLRAMPTSAPGVTGTMDSVRTVQVQVKDQDGQLLPSAIPHVRIVKTGNYHRRWERRGSGEADVLGAIDANLGDAPLAGFVGEGIVPFSILNNETDAALRSAVIRGMPVVMVARGNAEGFVIRRDLFIAGSNLTATKARILLMACLLRFGALPPAADPNEPTPEELDAIRAKLDEYQAVFDSH